MFTPFQLIGLLAKHDVLAGGAVDQLHEVRAIPDAEVQTEVPALCGKGFFLLAGQLLPLTFKKSPPSSALLTAIFSVMVSRQRRPKLPLGPNILVFSNSLAL